MKALPQPILSGIFLTLAAVGMASIVGAAPMVTNPSFEDNDVYIKPPGRIGDGNPAIIGWTASTAGRTGLNPGTTVSGTTFSPYADNGVIPDGVRVAVLQWHTPTDAVAGPNTLTQTVAGFHSGHQYIVSYRENARCYNGGDVNRPQVFVTLGGQTIVTPHAVSWVEAASQYTKPYHSVTSEMFTATAVSHNLVIGAVAADGSSAALIDRVDIYPAHLVFSDNFDVATGSNTINPSANDLPGRQGGFYAGATYTERVSTPGNFTQMSNPKYPGALFLASDNTFDGTSVSPDFNYKALGPGGTQFTAEFLVDPANPPLSGGTVDPMTWAGLIVGSSSQTSQLVASDGLGFLIRGNGGYVVFDKNSARFDGDLGEDFGIDESTFYRVRIDYFVSKFDGLAPVDVQIYVNDTLVEDFDTTTGFLNNYLVFDTRGGPNMTTSGIDDFRFFASYVPEPTSFVLLTLGVAVLGARCWSRRWAAASGN